MKKNPRWIVALAFLQLPLHSCATAKKDVASGQPAPPAPASEVQVELPADGLELRPLSEALESHWDGSASLDEESRARVAREARELADRASLRAAARECREGTDEALPLDRAAFCSVALKHQSRSARRRHASRLPATGKARLLAQLRAGRTDALASVGEDELLHALKKAGPLSRLARLIANAQALPEGDCRYAPLFAALGLKAEEDFPAPSARELAESLDERAFRCAGTPGLSARAAYRLGLLRAWNGDWDGVEEVYSTLLDAPEAAEYRSRIAYWRYIAAGENSDFFLQEQMKAILVDEYPLTLHGLLVSPIETDPHAPWADELLPRVALESRTVPALNPLLRLAEALLDQGERDAAVEALAFGQPSIQQAEGPVQLYAAVLLRRGGDTIHMFHLLSELFKEHSALITPQTLALLYPLQEYDIVSKYEDRADPYLVLSLIRQESAFNSRARSPVGALGLMQLMPRTARRLERVSKRTLLDPQVNVRIGIRYFNRLAERYAGDVELALAAYNAGPEKVDEWKERYPVADRVLFLDLIPFHETREYVAAIARNYYWYMRLYGPRANAQAGVDAKAPTRAKRSAVAAFRLFSS